MSEWVIILASASPHSLLAPHFIFFNRLPVRRHFYSRKVGRSTATNGIKKPATQIG
ncbi:MAG: hypothetical protein KME45_21450 [Stenomitos rutilans HA7619-LM2]|nr:hypothetical protein [Stenomitos rutilans HA7619-LM2]